MSNLRELQNIIKEAEGGMVEPTAEMVDWYEKRTKIHINNVQDAMKVIADKREDFNRKDLENRGKIHDQSKYGEIEKPLYIWLSWYHKCKREKVPFKYPPGMEAKVREATKHHIENNRHHTHFHSKISDMTRVDILEMVADWVAMSNELNSSTREWATGFLKKHKFDEQQIKLIWELINIFEPE